MAVETSAHGFTDVLWLICHVGLESPGCARLKTVKSGVSLLVHSSGQQLLLAAEDMRV